jgi:hypothetical protein
LKEYWWGRTGTHMDVVLSLYNPFSQWIRVRVEKLIVVQPVKKFSTFYEI